MCVRNGNRVLITRPAVLKEQKGWQSGGGSDGDRPFEAPLKRANIPLRCTMQSSIHRGIQLAPVAGNLK